MFYFSKRPLTTMFFFYFVFFIVILFLLFVYHDFPYIFKFLDLKNLSKIGEVCKFWYNEAQQNEFWPNPNTTTTNNTKMNGT